MPDANGLTILWGYCPPEVRAALRPILVDYLWLLSWCRNLYVRWDDHPKDNNDSMCSDAQPEYRQAQLFVHPGWLGAVHSSRVTQLVHEFLHVPMAPMVKEHDDLVKRLLDDAPKFEGYSQEQWRRLFEGTVQDLAYSISRIAGPMPAVPFTEVEDDDVPRARTWEVLPA